GLSDLGRDRSHERRHGVGDDRRRRPRRIDVLRRPRAHRAGADLLASIVPPGAGLDGNDKEEGMKRFAIVVGAAGLALTTLIAEAADKLTLQLKWVTQAQFA